MQQIHYPYEFAPHELESIKACNDEHGFAVVKGMITPEYVEDLKADVRRVLNPHDSLLPGQSTYSPNFVEVAPASWKLLECGPYMKLYRHLLQSDELTIHRSAAIIRMPSAGPVTWHTDYSFFPDPPQNVNHILNRIECPSGAWFYLNGTHPDRGGLAVIADSHRPDWSGPQGFQLTADKHTFYREGTTAEAYAGMDVPGVVPLLTDPGDLIVFAARTYHAATAHYGDEPRLSCSVVFRAGQTPYPVPWPLPASARAFQANAPLPLQPFLDHYTGIEPAWKPAATA